MALGEVCDGYSRVLQLGSWLSDQKRPMIVASSGNSGGDAEVGQLLDVAARSSVDVNNDNAIEVFYLLGKICSLGWKGKSPKGV